MRTLEIRCYSDSLVAICALNTVVILMDSII